MEFLVFNGNHNANRVERSDDTLEILEPSNKPGHSNQVSSDKITVDTEVLMAISLFWMVIAIINFSPVSIYGEFEFYLACCKVGHQYTYDVPSVHGTSVKIALIVCFVVAGAALDLGVYSGQDFIGLRYWQDPYPLFRQYLAEGGTGKFLGFWSAMLAAAFAFGNVQVVAMAGAETLNPRKSIPGALKKTFLRVVAFYVASIFVISLTVPANDERLFQPTGDVTHSPFIIAFNRAGLKVRVAEMLCSFFSP